MTLKLISLDQTGISLWEHFCDGNSERKSFLRQKNTFRVIELALHCKDHASAGACLLPDCLELWLISLESFLHVHFDKLQVNRDNPFTRSHKRRKSPGGLQYNSRCFWRTAAEMRLDFLCNCGSHVIPCRRPYLRRRTQETTQMTLWRWPFCFPRITNGRFCADINVTFICQQAHSLTVNAPEFFAAAFTHGCPH